MWASDLGFEILGTRFRVQSQVDGVSLELERLWHGWRRMSTSARLRHTYAVVAGDGGLTLYRDCALLARTRRVPSLILRLLMEVNRESLVDFAGFAAHAAVLASPRRVAAVLAESGIGKTTLSAAAVLAGLEYGSDEALCLDRSSRDVIPYPRPLGLSAHSQELLGVHAGPTYDGNEEAPVVVEDLGGVAMGSGRKLTDLVIPARTDDELPRWERLSPSDGAVALLANSFNHFRDPQGSYLLTAAVASECAVWRFTYSEPRRAGQAMAQHLTE